MCCAVLCHAVQVGVLAAAGLVGLDDFEAGLLLADHCRARRLAEQVGALRGFWVDVEAVQTNICVVHLSDQEECMSGGGEGAEQSVAESSFCVDWVVQQLAARGLQVLARDRTSLRIVMHRDITDDCVEALVDGFREVSETLKKGL
jgi:threonine aldolase